MLCCRARWLDRFVGPLRKPLYHDVIVVDSVVIVADWSLAPEGVRKRADRLLLEATPAWASVMVLQFEKRGLLTSGAWVVALIAADDGRRVFNYAEDDDGNVLAEWGYGEDAALPVVSATPVSSSPVSGPDEKLVIVSEGEPRRGSA